MSYPDVRGRVSDGDGPVGFVIEQNFTDSLVTRYMLLLVNSLLLWCLLLRYQQLCEAHFDPNVDYPSLYVIEYSTIALSVDATGKELMIIYNAP